MHYEKFRPVLADRPLRLLFYNQATATLATRAFDIVVVWLALERGSSYAEAGLLIFFRFIPYILFGLLGGWISDRGNKRNIVVICDLLRAIVLFLLALCIAYDVYVIPALGISTFILTSLRTIFQPALQGLLPQLAPKGMIASANAVLHSCNEVCGMIAPAIAGFMLAALPAEAVVVAAACLFLAAVLFGMALRVDHQPQAIPITFSAIRSDYAAAIHELNVNQRPVRTAILANALAIVGVGGLLSLGVPAVMEANPAFGAATLGLFTAAMALGTLPGAYVAAFVSDDRQTGTMYIAWLLYGCLIALTVWLPDRMTLLGLGLVLGFTGAVADILFATIIQQNIPGKHVSKTFALFSTAANSGEAISGPMMAAIISASSLGMAFGLGGLLVVGVSTVGLILTMRSRGRLLRQGS